MYCLNCMVNVVLSIGIQDGLIEEERGKYDGTIKSHRRSWAPSAAAARSRQRGVGRSRLTMPSIKLQSSDGEIFEVDVEIAKQSVTIKTMLEDLGMDDEGDDDPVPLPNVNAAILKKVIQWCTHHKDDPPPPEDDENKEKRTDDIPVWDQEFLKVDQGTLFELILAANYLDIKGLLDVTMTSLRRKKHRYAKRTSGVKRSEVLCLTLEHFLFYRLVKDVI
ncbi:S-phase kinase-associated protein 1 [Patagioenas fasciata monilis]|uniref:S-phase kinase-associated protein 1 n=1 Tax=Patagioenas fasciata monilis TaxID=372326 RepID=A0A1V4KUV1_PATFA|nr:S-phase kinase-associated protein 1 [Patagioenas fasciata monilis]